jgi:hypothetical protein
VIEFLRSDNSETQITFTAASGVTSVTFEAYDLDTDEFIQAGTAASGASLVYTGTLTANSSAYDRNVKLEWISSTASGASATINYSSLTRPFVTVTRARSITEISSSETDANIKKLERKARLYLQSHIGVDFTKQYKTVVVYGNGSDVLFLPEPIIRIDKVYEDDILIYDKISTASVNNFEYDLEPSTSKNRIKIINTEDEFEKNVNESSDTALFPFQGNFRKDKQYRILGIFGYQYVPNAIEQATAILIEDYLCNDFNIRNKNISKLSNDSYDLAYANTSALGTGNLLVDKLISPWMTQPRYMVI